MISVQVQISDVRISRLLLMGLGADTVAEWLVLIWCSVQRLGRAVIWRSGTLSELLWVISGGGWLEGVVMENSPVGKCLRVFRDPRSR